MEEFMELCSPVPHCPGCGGVVKPDVVLYEEMLDRNTIEDAIDEISHADMLISAGRVWWFIRRRDMWIISKATPWL